MQKLAEKLRALAPDRLFENEPMSKHTTFRVGGPADLMFYPESREEISAAIEAAKAENVPVYVIGNGSNLLVRDGGIRGLVIRIAGDCASIRREFPDALCLGTGGCRICGSCAWPEPCRFPAQACPSMEGYGLFVTQVCRSNGLAYHHGENTVTYTACVLFSSKDADGNLT